jgi:hypothetical protein
LNENTNGLLRQYWSKSTDFKKASQSVVQDVIVNLNHRPRRKLNYKTPAKLMAKHMLAIAARGFCTSRLNLPDGLDNDNAVSVENNPNSIPRKKYLIATNWGD